MQIPLDALPSTSPLFLDYIRRWRRVERFYPRPHSIDEVERFARGNAGPDPSRRSELARVLETQQREWKVDPGPAGRLARGAVAVIAGQQAGLFTGPMYSVLKALTAVKVARALRERGVDAVPVFWIAAEDHDHQEIEWAGIFGSDGGFHRVKAELVGDERAPVGWMRFTDGIAGTIEHCFTALPDSEYHAETLRLVKDIYRTGVSPVVAFARMLGRLFQGTELLLVDPLDPAFRSLAEWAMDQAVERADDIRSAVVERSRLVTAAGYAAQVQVDNGFTGFFAYRGQSREPLRRGESATVSALSPNALLRPVVQDLVFPTAAYVGGPAEIAYFAQASAVYDCLGMPMPPVFPRITATVVEPPVARVMKKYGFRIGDVFEGPDHLRRKAVGTIHETGGFGVVRDEVTAAVERLRTQVEGVDPTLGGAMDTALRKIRYQVDRLETRFVNAEARRNETLLRQLSMVSNRLFPERKLQERSVNVTSFLVRYGPGFVGMLDAALELNGTAHQVVEL